MTHIQIYTDGSVNTQLKVGYGAYLVVPDESTPIEKLNDEVKTKRFEQTSSTKLELQTLLWHWNKQLLWLANAISRLPFIPTHKI